MNDREIRCGAVESVHLIGWWTRISLHHSLCRIAIMSYFERNNLYVGYKRFFIKPVTHVQIYPLPPFLSLLHFHWLNNYSCQNGKLIMYIIRTSCCYFTFYRTWPNRRFCLFRRLSRSKVGIVHDVSSSVSHSERCSHLSLSGNFKVG